MAPRILVIDDERDVLSVLCDVLEMEGFDVICIDDPELITRHTLQTPPDLFVIDLMLPGTSGIKLAAELRRRGHQDTPMIAISASHLMVGAAQQSGLFQETIPKPFDLDEILQAVQQHVP